MPNLTTAMPLPSGTSNSRLLKYMLRHHLITSQQYVEAWKVLSRLKRDPKMELPDELIEVWEKMHLLRRPAPSLMLH